MASPPDRAPRFPLRFVPLLLLPLIGLLASILVVLSTHNPDGDDSPGAADYASPPPVTFIPPTSVPVTPDGVPAQAIRIDEPTPDVVLTTLDGESIHLGDLAGEIVFLNVWATWCEPCRREMPALQALHDEHRAEGVRVITLTDPALDQTESDIRDFLADYDLTLPVALSSDPDLYEQFYRFLPFEPLPATFIIDRAGTLRFGHIGELHPDDIRAYLDLLADDGR